MNEEETMSDFDVVIAHGGRAATRAAESYRAGGGSGRVARVAEEPTLPYHRPELKALLKELIAERAIDAHADEMAGGTS